MKKKIPNMDNRDEWLQDIINAASTVITGYEKFLLDLINEKELARLVLSLRELLPTNPNIRKDDKNE